MSFARTLETCRNNYVSETGLDCIVDNSMAQRCDECMKGTQQV